MPKYSKDLTEALEFAVRQRERYAEEIANLRAHIRKLRAEIEHLNSHHAEVLKFWGGCLDEREKEIEELKATYEPR